MPVLNFPSTLIPNYVSDLELPDYGFQENKTDHDQDRRHIRYQTGQKTVIKLLYSGLSAEEMAMVVDFYRSARGTYEPFIVANEVLLQPSGYLDSLFDLGDTQLWRFGSAPVIRTLVDDNYSCELMLVSQQNEVFLSDHEFSYTSTATISLISQPVTFSAATSGEIAITPEITLLADSVTIDTGTSVTNFVKTTTAELNFVLDETVYRWGQYTDATPFILLQASDVVGKVIDEADNDDVSSFGKLGARTQELVRARITLFTQSNFAYKGANKVL